ncbi:redoxin domain-containing protein [Candidatus Poribacteria bacterium]|nr:redoxin domain-containing protein [Candidatus Poribacteria bacterium]MYH82043.1 redoxin domain-containing protein [Candidatus Poribacteria bacterium]MYK95224.1 redoxin domain-containing protein [Candidatus Poribacteria bacterium]
MFSTKANRWCYLTIVLIGVIVFSSCVSSTLNTAGSTSITDNEAYAEIKAIAGKLKDSGDPAAYEVLVEKSTVFINAYPKYRQVDEVYYLLGTGLIQLDRIEEGIGVFEELIRYYPAADYVEPSFLTLGLAYDKAGEHDKADRLYEKLVNHTKYRGGRFSGVAQQLLEQDWDTRTGEVADASGTSASPGPSRFINTPAFDFQVTDLKGETLSLTQYRGQVVLLDCWATWCGPCIAEMPNVKATYAKYKNQKFEIIGISLDRSTPPLEAYIASEGLTWRQYYDNGGRISNMYNVRAIPSTFLIDGAGIIRQVNLRGTALEIAVDELVRENLEN